MWEVLFKDERFYFGWLGGLQYAAIKCVYRACLENQEHRSFSTIRLYAGAAQAGPVVVDPEECAKEAKHIAVTVNLPSHLWGWWRKSLEGQ